MRLLINPEDDAAIVATASRLQTKLTSLLHALRKDPKNDNGWLAIREALQDAIVYFSIKAYNSGVADIKMRPRMSDLIKLRHDAEARAKWVAEHMEAFTQMSLGIKAAKDKKKKLLSSKRAAVVAMNEMRVAFYSGKLKGWKQDKTAKKEWLVSDAHDQDDLCDDNQDDGIIDIDQPFSTGDMNPPAHINCNCVLFLHLV